MANTLTINGTFERTDGNVTPAPKTLLAPQLAKAFDVAIDAEYDISVAASTTDKDIKSVVIAQIRFMVIIINGDLDVTVKLGGEPMVGRFFAVCGGGTPTTLTVTNANGTTITGRVILGGTAA